MTGGASALVGTIGSLMGGVTDIPTDIFRHIGRLFKKKDKSETADKDATEDTLKPLTLQSGLDAARGAQRVVTAGMKSPMDFTLALAKGFQNAPKLYGDKTVREAPKVTDFSSGVKAATVVSIPLTPCFQADTNRVLERASSTASRACSRSLHKAPKRRASKVSSKASAKP